MLVKKFAYPCIQAHEKLKDAHNTSVMTPHVAVSVLLRSFSRILAGVLLALVVLVAIGAIVVAQAGRDEAVTADTAVLMVDGTPTGRGARVDRAVRLYLAGDIVRMVLAGAQTVEARDALIARGLAASPPADQGASRSFMLRDPDGYEWHFHQSLM